MLGTYIQTNNAFSLNENREPLLFLYGEYLFRMTTLSSDNFGVVQRFPTYARVRN